MLISFGPTAFQARATKREVEVLTSPHKCAILVVQFLQEQKVARVSDVVDMPEFSHSCEFWAGEMSGGMEEQAIYGYTREQAREVGCCCLE